uniref:TMV resistance protein N-like n=1 Tax=Erigeron canadensis TaxID=72917 RepID=UPI001CB8E932|nr:TMV resistance protein N-like [Erigeron canadensis]XP_043635492.1 TMV resistance protein N-like [Erigeron canadensis]
MLLIIKSRTLRETKLLRHMDHENENHKIEAVNCSDHLLCFGKIISNMKKLRWLSYESRGINNMKDVEGPNFLSNELRYFYWQWYSASPFLDGIPPMTLVVLKMSESWQKELWNGYKHLPHLKVLELEFMGNLLGIPDFGGLPCLKKLKLLCCSHLEEIHPSLGNHRSLENISVSTCSVLRVFPKIVRMEKLNNLEISDCNNYIELPEIQTKMGRLVNLTLEGSENEFPDSPIGECYTHLETVFYRPLKDIVQKLNFRSLRKLNLGGWGLKDGEIPSDFGELSNLEELDLSRNDFSHLDFSICHLTQLRLCLSNCKRLVELPELLSSVAILIVDFCDSLT